MKLCRMTRIKGTDVFTVINYITIPAYAYQIILVTSMRQCKCIIIFFGRITCIFKDERLDLNKRFPDFCCCSNLPQLSVNYKIYFVHSNVKMNKQYLFPVSAFQYN